MVWDVGRKLAGPQPPGCNQPHLHKAAAVHYTARPSTTHDLKKLHMLPVSWAWLQGMEALTGDRVASFRLRPRATPRGAAAAPRWHCGHISLQGRERQGERVGLGMLGQH